MGVNSMAEIDRRNTVSFLEELGFEPRTKVFNDRAEKCFYHPGLKLRVWVGSSGLMTWEKGEM